ncbi:hypothetical protein HDV00_011544 [Rhizophlyctis rosea]|nr:hypothetical protein HDV00_011544 [Rhizophlyctis rosea]
MIIPQSQIYAPLPLPPHDRIPLTHKLKSEVQDLERTLDHTQQLIHYQTLAAERAQREAKEQHDVTERGVKIEREMPRDDGLYVLSGGAGRGEGEKGVGVEKEVVNKKGVVVEERRNVGRDAGVEQMSTGRGGPYRGGSMSQGYGGTKLPPNILSTQQPPANTVSSTLLYTKCRPHFMDNLPDLAR